MNITIKRLLTTAIGSLLLIGTKNFCMSRTDGFLVSNITPYKELYKAFEIPSYTSDDLLSIQDILKQPFTYLAKGTQSYAFVSKDQNYVLKFFRMHRLEPPRIGLDVSLTKYIKTRRQHKDYSQNQDFVSYAIAHEHFKENTGILYLQLSDSKTLDSVVTLYDKINVRHRIPLQGMRFVLQRRADLFMDLLQSLIDTKQEDLAKKYIFDLLAFLKQRSVKGFYDSDPELATNFGVAEGKLIQIDIGRFSKDASRQDPSIFQRDISQITSHLYHWLQKKDPSLADYLIQQQHLL